MSKLSRQFEAETGKDPYTLYDYMTVATKDYVKWLEKRVGENLPPTNEPSAPCYHPPHHSTNAKIIYCLKCGAIVG